MTQFTDTSSFSPLAPKVGSEPIEERLRTNVRATIVPLQVYSCYTAKSGVFDF